MGENFHNLCTSLSTSCTAQNFPFSAICNSKVFTFNSHPFIAAKLCMKTIQYLGIKHFQRFEMTSKIQPRRPKVKMVAL